MVLMALLLMMDDPARGADVKSAKEAMESWRAAGYDKLTRPNAALNLTTAPDQIKMGFNVVRVWGVNPVEESFQIEGFLRLSWRDPRLAFNITPGYEHQFDTTTPWVESWWDGASMAGYAAVPSLLIDVLSDPELVHEWWDPMIYSTDSIQGRGLDHR
jgi:hypothetical protein